jgi:ATP-dependent helicase HepA
MTVETTGLPAVTDRRYSFMHDTFHPGQRWISESEPELGLGAITRVTDRRVTAVFGATGQMREYSRAHAPLRRVKFRSGDTIKDHSGSQFVVESVSERGGLIFYGFGPREVCETELSDSISFNKPEERLLAGQLDAPRVFDLRVAALEHQHRRRKSTVRGFVGGRIDLIPHQLYIASEVAGRLAPRVLLADEVGLGKTIEACLIVHRLILTGRAQRVLVIVPDSLVHQWFVELLRRFNLWFSIFDEERCQAIQILNPAQNPFLDDQLIVCSLNLFIKNERRAEQAVAAGWDIVVVDEAHHLAWSPEKVSPEYAFVETLGRKTPGLLLLTATPEQLGMASHFARLRLLDPDRFYDLHEFIKEEQQYQDVARRAENLLDVKTLNELLDRHGTGRVRFRNTRATITGFPRRVARLAPLEAHASKAPLLDWLASLLLSIEPDKVLLICRTQAKVSAIDAGLRQRIKNVKIAVFHEGLSLVQRDRNAAWFGEEHGARILICSEIGSEGRNFQFAHHLVLFDLPLDPELLEQRIGRLDRIGQTNEIQVHVPFVAGSGQEVLARWYHEGLNAFEKNLQGGSELLDRFGARVYELSQRFHKTEKTSRAKLSVLIEETKAAHMEITTRLQQGRDRLLELNSFRPEAAATLVDEIRRQDQEASLDEFMLSVFDHYSIHIDELALRTYRLGSAGVLADSFPGLPAEGLSVTADRQRALAREDVQFLTWDHPLVTGALDLVLGSEKGNSSFAHWPDAKTSGLYLEAIYVLECIAPPHLNVDRFLPPTPLRLLVDHQRMEIGITPRDLKSADQPEMPEDLLPDLLEGTYELATKRVAGIVDAARREMAAQLGHEIARLQELQKVNRTVRTEEIELLVEQRRALDEHLQNARLRLDAVRLIQRGVMSSD